MNAPPNLSWDDLWREVLANEPPVEESHPIDDDELLARWETGQLDADEHDRIFAHLARCADCREELHDLLEAGVLRLPAPTGEQLPVPTILSPANPAGGAPRRLVIASLMTLGLLVGVCTWTLWPTPQDIPSPIAPLLTAVERGEHAQALAMTEELTAANLTREEYELAVTNLERAAVHIARERLQHNDFAGVDQTLARLSGWQEVLDSPRLRNLELQALRQSSSEIALADAGSVLDYGFQIDGSPLPGKSLPMVDETTDRIRERFRRAITTHPTSIPLRLNHGQFLLSLSDFEPAATEFRAVLALDPDNPHAHLGLGLIAMTADEFSAARSHFETAKQSNILGPEILLNLAAAEQRLGNRDAAIDHLTEAARLTEDDLHTRITTHLSRLKGMTP